MLKNIGAIFPPITIPPVFLFGTKGIFSPICQIREFIADFLELPVPTTSPTYSYIYLKEFSDFNKLFGIPFIILGVILINKKNDWF